MYVGRKVGIKNILNNKVIHRKPMTKSTIFALHAITRNYAANNTNQTTLFLVSQRKALQNLPCNKLQKTKCNLFTKMHVLPNAVC